MREPVAHWVDGRLRCIVFEKAQHTSQTLATALAEERAVKRARPFVIS